MKRNSEVHAPSPDLLRVPGWEQYPWLRAGFSLRGGDTSVDEGNLGWTVGTDDSVVAANRIRFTREVLQSTSQPAEDLPAYQTGQAGASEALHTAAWSLVTVRQVHSARVRDLEDEAAPFQESNGRARLEGDGLISRSPGRLLAVLTADCVPVLVADRRTHAVGAFHAGWRGTLAGIAGLGVTAMRDRYGSRPMDLIAAVGPCIQACCFAVGSEIRDAFVTTASEAAQLFSATQADGLHMDLSEANRQQLQAAGVAPASVTVMRFCTACARDERGRRRFFSYRAEGGKTGRMLSAVAALW